jgi:hypothetical protein
MRTVSLMIVVATGVALTACGGGVDLSGMWQVTAHTLNDTACDMPGPAVADPPYIRFEEGNLFGVKYFQYGDCTDATEASCDGGGGLFGLLYSEEIDNGWQAQIYVASGQPGNCFLSSTLSTALVEEGVLSIETRSSEMDNVDTPCADADEAKREMPCVQLEMLSGVRPGG